MLSKILTFLLIVLTIYSQDILKCVTDERYAERKAKNPLIEKLEREASAYARQYVSNYNLRTKQVITIPVVVHVVYKNSTENLPDSVIESQIQVLNEDFRKLNADTVNIPSYFKSIAADFQIEFCLAKRDPTGNPTTGITRTFTTVQQFGGDEVKSSATGGADAWPSDQYLNIWVCDLGPGALGYAQFPWEVNTSPNTDGIVVNYRNFGRPAVEPSNFDKGRTATHEIGHWLGLYHNFQGGCAGTNSTTCASQGDEVCDTPPQANPNNGCPTTIPNTCTETPTDMPDMINNYMDYSYDDCLNMFTVGQKNRAYAMLTQYRPWVFNVNVTYMCTPVTFGAGFNADKLQICAGDTITFYDASVGNPTSWQWLFPGGTPATSAQQNPKVVYNSPGTYDVTLIISDGTKNDTLKKTAYISVVSPTGAPIPFTEDFESNSLNTNSWTVINPDNDITWQIGSIGGTSPGNKAVYMDFYNYNWVGARDFLISKAIDLKNAINPVLSFEHAYALYSTTGNYTDSLIIYAVDACTNKEYRLLSLGENGSYNFATVPPYTQSAFFPSLPSHWCFASTNSQGCYKINLSQFIGKIIKIKFEAYNDYENNLFIDNINIKNDTSTTILQDLTMENIKVFPSTAYNYINIVNNTNYNIFIKIIDITGKTLITAPNVINYSKIDVSSLSPGTYFVEITYENGIKITKKFIKM